jgi:hypothetical protein
MCSTSPLTYYIKSAITRADPKVATPTVETPGAAEGGPSEGATEGGPSKGAAEGRPSEARKQTCASSTFKLVSMQFEA